MMGKFDELFIKAKELADAAGNKAQEMAELTKLRLQVAQLRSDLDANYLKMGEIVYELKKAKTENEDLITMCIAEIDAQHEELEALEAKMNELKNEAKCPACMASNPKNALYCSRCGTALTPFQQESQPAEAPTLMVVPNPESDSDKGQEEPQEEDK